MTLQFVNALKANLTITASVDSLAEAEFALQYFDAAGALQPLGQSTRLATFSWQITAGILPAPGGDPLNLLLMFKPYIQQGSTNLWLRADQPPTGSLQALNYPDPGNRFPPYRACSAMNATTTPYAFQIKVA
jgi:hypothetical protein